MGIKGCWQRRGSCILSTWGFGCAAQSGRGIPQWRRVGGGRLRSPWSTILGQTETDTFLQTSLSTYLLFLFLPSVIMVSAQRQRQVYVQTMYLGRTPFIAVTLYLLCQECPPVPLMDLSPSLTPLPLLWSNSLTFGCIDMWISSVA